jgi:hypothetical protein
MNDINPIEENLSKKDALSIRREIKAIAESKIGIDLSFCEHIFYSKKSYVIASSGSIPFYQYCGYPSWREYIENEVGTTVNKANKYSAVYSKYFVELENVFDASKHAIDISKMIYLLPIINEKNCISLLKKAKSASKETLKDLNSTSAVKATHKSISYRIDFKEAKLVEKAMKLARQDFGEELTDGQIFVAIMAEYMENTKGIKKSA